MSEVLQDLLNRERDRNRELERELALLQEKVREIRPKTVGETTEHSAPLESRSRFQPGREKMNAKTRGLWRILGGD